MSRQLSFLILFLSLAGISRGSDIFVPGDFPTIQDAIDAAAAGDWIWVDPGTYVENIDFIGKDVVVASLYGALYTTIDGNRAGPVVTFNSGETMLAVLDGFTLTNGYAFQTNGGGGIDCQGASPTIENNIIEGNEALMNGGGIYSYGACQPAVTENIIRNNLAWTGGGIADASDGLFLANNIIAGNTASYQGGGLFFFNSNNVTVLCNTIAGNTAQDGGGIFAEEFTNTEIANTILWGDQASSGPEIYQAGFWFPSTMSISYSDVKGGMNSVYVEPNATLNWGAGMIDADPLFVDSSSGDYHIEIGSPCFNSGDPNAPDLPEWDFENDPRGLFSTVGIGADEFWYHLYHGGKNIPGNSIDLNVVGRPGQPVVFGVSKDIYEPPRATPYGDLRIVFPLLWQGYLGAVPSSGNLHAAAKIPSGWTPQEVYFIQALVGHIGVSTTRLTNDCPLYVE